MMTKKEFDEKNPIIKTCNGHGIETPEFFLKPSYDAYAAKELVKEAQTKIDQKLETKEEYVERNLKEYKIFDKVGIKRFSKLFSRGYDEDPEMIDNIKAQEEIERLMELLK